MNIPTIPNFVIVRPISILRAPPPEKPGEINRIGKPQAMSVPVSEAIVTPDGEAAKPVRRSY